MKFLIRTILFICLFHTQHSFASELGSISFKALQGPRYEALLKLAKEFGYEILFSHDAVPSDSVNAFSEALPLEEALNKLLEKTDLQYRIKKKQIRINRIGKEFSILPKVTVLGYLRNTGQSISTGDDSLEQFPLYNLPLSIQSVTDEYFEEVQASELEDVLSYIGGIEFLNTSEGINPVFYSRGVPTPFSIDGKFYRRTFLTQDPITLERIDIIQGPSANFLLPGGIINFVSKKPQKESFGHFSLTTGSWDYNRSEFDINLSNASDDFFAARFVGAVENANHFKEFSEHSKYVLSPSLLKEFKDKSQLKLHAVHTYRSQTANTTTVHKDTIVRPVPVDKLLTYPWSKASSEETYTSLDYTNYKIGKWRLNTGANWYLSHLDNSPVVFLPVPDGNALAFRNNSDNRKVETYGFDVAIEKNINIGGTETLTRIGVDAQNWNIHNPIYTTNPNPDLPGNTEFLGFANIYNLDYDFPEPEKPKPTGKHQQLSDFIGLFISQNLYLSDDITLYLDLRYEDIQTKITRNDYALFNSHLPVEFQSIRQSDWNLKSHYQEWTPRLGLNANITERFSSHISYSESFSTQDIPKEGAANGSLDILNGEMLDPIRNQQIEIAFKNKVLDEKLLSNLTFYHIKASNVGLTWDNGPGVENTKFDDRYSSGLSFALNGSLSQNTNLILNYSYNEIDTNHGATSHIQTQSNTVQDIIIYENITAPGTAKSLLNAWISYDSKTGPLKDYEIGLGMKYVGDRYVDRENTLVMPKYRTGEAVIRYSGLENFEIAFVVKNIWKQYYYKGALYTNFLVEEGDPRSFNLTLKSTHNF